MANGHNSGLSTNYAVTRTPVQPAPDSAAQFRNVYPVIQGLKQPAALPRKSIFTESFSPKSEHATLFSGKSLVPLVGELDLACGKIGKESKPSTGHGGPSGNLQDQCLRPHTADKEPSIRRVPEDIENVEADMPAGQKDKALSAASFPFSQAAYRAASCPLQRPTYSRETSRSGPPTPVIQLDSPEGDTDLLREHTELQYYHRILEDSRKRAEQRASRATISTIQSSSSESQTVSSSGDHNANFASQSEIRVPRTTISRPTSTFTLGSQLHLRGRSNTPQGFRPDHSLSPSPYGRSVSASGRPPDNRSVSTVDLLNIPYAQQLALHTQTLHHTQLLNSVGRNASLLDTMKTLEMYRANVKKTNDQAIQYEFAVFMVNAAQEADTSANSDRSPSPKPGGVNSKAELLREARHILQKLSDRTYPYAQYYLADGYASGLFNRGKQDYERAFPLFVSAGKHGHAEAGYRAALCYEFGWGCRRDYAKAVQFYRQSASKAHPGAATRLGKACLTGDMGLGGKGREGIKWLKRATESADHLHNSAPHELGLLHITGHGEDVFKDEAYAAQLFTKAADLGHPEANLRMGEAYEHGLLMCPRDPALSLQ